MKWNKCNIIKSNEIQCVKWNELNLLNKINDEMKESKKSFVHPQDATSWGIVKTTVD